MNEIQDCLNELNLSPNEAYKELTGYSLKQELEESDDTTSEHSSIDEELKPPLYTYEEICNNLIVVGKSESNENNAELIANKLKEYLQSNYCFICKKKGTNHYVKSRHYNRVSKWLKQELEKSKVKIHHKYIFCQACNKALSGIESTAQAHYQSALHKQNFKSFCSIWIRSIGEKNMVSHIKSKKHITKQEKVFIAEKCDQPNLTDIQKNDQNNTLRVKIGHLDLTLVKNADEPWVPSAYAMLINILMDLLRPSFCYICHSPGVAHYRNINHRTSLRNWMETFAKEFGFSLFNIRDLICFDCHALFLTQKHAAIHYSSSGHSRRMAFVQKSNVVEEVLECQPNPFYSLIDGRSIPFSYNEYSIPQISNRLKIHGIDTQVIIGLIQEKPSLLAECDPIVKTIVELMTPTYCFICNKSALKNNKGIFRHYTYVSHMTDLKHFIESKRKLLGFNSMKQQSIYCEWCNLIFLNFEQAENHYKSPEHRRYCTWCHDSNKSHFESTLDEFEFGSENRVSSNRSARNEFGESDNSENEEIYCPSFKTSYSIPAVKPKTPKTTWPKLLADMTKLNECKICAVGFDSNNLKLTQSHYESEFHNERVKIWLEHYNKFGFANKDAVENWENRIQCTFCGSFFSTENELQKHQDVHFPTLGNSNRSQKSSISSVSKVDAEKSPATFIKNDFPSNYQDQIQEISRSNKCELQKLTEQINQEMIKLYNTVYVFKALPLNKSLVMLRNLNQTLIESSKNHNTTNQKVNEATENITQNNFSKTPLPLMNKTQNNHQAIANSQRSFNETKLFMEIQRLRTSISNKNKIPIDMAYTCLELLIRLLLSELSNRPCQFDIQDIFLACYYTLPIEGNSQKKLLDVLDKLNEIAWNGYNTNKQVVLDMVTQFNICLEKFSFDKNRLSDR